MKKFFSILVILLFVLGTATVIAQDAQPAEPADQAAEPAEPAEGGETLGAEDQQAAEPAETPAAEAPAAEAPAAEAQAEEPAVQPAEEQPADQALGAGAAGATPKVASPYINLTFLAGQSLTDNAGTQLGTIQDAFLTSDGMVSHVITDVQNAPGVRTGVYVFPISYFQYEQNQLKLNLPANPQFQMLTGAKTAGAVASDSIQASNLLAFNVVDQQGRNIGRIQDVVLNMEDGTISYTAVAFSGVLGAADKIFAVPYSEIWYNLNSKVVTIYNINQTALERNPGIDMNNWPETADPNWNTVR